MRVLIVGAGSTYSDGMNRAPSRRPPLDKGFFRVASRTDRVRVMPIQEYLMTNYGIDITASKDDSLEAVMVKLYSDTFHPSLGKEAYPLFRALVELYSHRLMKTTDSLPHSDTSKLFAILSNLLRRGATPSDTCIITFNQDLHAERVLLSIRKDIQFGGMPGIFNFPYCYGLGVTEKDITGPTRKVSVDSLFPVGNEQLSGISVLKLHGSLNWYSLHLSRNVSRTALFNPKRKLHVTKRLTIPPDMTFSAKRTEYTFPVIVPPIPHKAGILHSSLYGIWGRAEECLRQAEEVIVFGYSSPVFDTEASNLLSRTLRKAAVKSFSLITPDAHLVGRYADITGLSEIHYFRNVASFLKAHQLA